MLNSDYSIDPVAYQWNSRQNVDVTLAIPSWLEVESAYELTLEEGVKKASFQLKDQSLSFRIPDIEAYKMYVFDTKHADITQLQAEYDKLKGMEE